MPPKTNHRSQKPEIKVIFLDKLFTVYGIKKNLLDSQVLQLQDLQLEEVETTIHLQ